MGVVIETCTKYRGGPTRIAVADIIQYMIYCTEYQSDIYIYQWPSFKLDPRGILQMFL
jgi:hypothetical protein